MKSNRDDYFELTLDSARNIYFCFKIEDQLNPV